MTRQSPPGGTPDRPPDLKDPQAGAADVLRMEIERWKKITEMVAAERDDAKAEADRLRAALKQPWWFDTLQAGAASRSEQSAGPNYWLCDECGSCHRALCPACAAADPAAGPAAQSPQEGRLSVRHLLMSARACIRDLENPDPNGKWNTDSLIADLDAAAAEQFASSPEPYGRHMSEAIEPKMEPAQTLLIEDVRRHVSSFALAQILAERGYDVKLRRPSAATKARRRAGAK